MKTREFLCWALFSFALCVQAETRIADCVIYLPKNSPDSVETAAEELLNHIKMTTGMELPVVNTPRSPMIALGDSPSARKAGIDISKEPYETHIIRTVGKDLYIVGRDLPGDELNEFGGHSYGTLYGTYAFLNKEMGIEWLMPSQKGIYYRNLGKDWEIPEMNIRFTPAFDYRFLMFIPNSREDFIQWKRRCKNDRWGAGSTSCSGDHTWHLIYPGPNTPLSKVNKDCFATFKEHPEFFGAAEDGTRIAPHSNFPLCITNPATVEDAAKRYVNLAKWSKKKAPYPFEYHIVGISPNDNNYCRCSVCRSQYKTLTEKDVGEMEADYRSIMCNTDMVLNYYRKVTEHCEKELEGKVRTYGLIYGAYEFAGKKQEKMPTSFQPIMAPLHTAYGPARIYEPINQTWHKWLNDWDGVFTRKTYHGLEFWFRQEMGMPWPVFPSLMKDTFQTLVQKDFKGVMVYGLPNEGAGGATNWILMKMMWDPSQDPDKLLDEYCEKGYGKGGKAIRKMYDLGEKNVKAYMTEIKARMGYNMTAELAYAAYGKDWDQYRALFAEAVAAPKDENQKWRLEMLRQNLRILNYHLVKMGLAQEDPTSLLYLNDKDFFETLPLRMKKGEWEGYVGSGYRNPNSENCILPVQKTEPVKLDAKKNTIWFVYGRDFLIQAASDAVEMKIVQTAYQNPLTGKPYADAVMNFNVFNPVGKELCSGIADRNTIRFPAEPGKLYYLLMTPITDYSYANRWRVESCNSPYASGQRIQPNGMRLYFTDTESKVFFFVPENISRFTLFCNETHGSVSVLDAEGKEVASKTGLRGYHAFQIGDETAPMKSGWFTIRLGKQTCGVFLLSPEVAPAFVTDPENGLKVTVDKEALKKSAVKTY